MKKKYNITMKQIIKMRPCYDPTKYADKNWKGTIFDILNHPDLLAVDKIWIVCRAKFMCKSDSVKFANFCSERANAADGGLSAAIALANDAAANAADAADAAANAAAADAARAAIALANDAAADAAADAANAAAYAADAAVVTVDAESQKQVNFLIKLLGGLV